MAERREGFIYIKSDLLNQEVAYSLKTGWVYCQDKREDGSLVSYSPKELEILAKTGSVITPDIHNVKKIIGGTIVECEDRAGNDNKGKPNAEQSPNGSLDNKNPPGSIPGPGGNDQINREGELDIY